MADARHPKRTSRADPEPVTEGFREQANAALESNDRFNRRHGLKFGEHGYRISSQAELAKHLGLKNQRMISKILGAVREDSETIKLVKRSALVHAIRVALDLPPITQLDTPVPRAELLRRLIEMPAKDFDFWAAEILGKTPRS